MRKLFLTAALGLSVSLFGGDCVPLTFRTLSVEFNRSETVATWTKLCMPNEQMPTTMDAVAVWNKKFPDLKMVCVLSRAKEIKAVDRDIVLNAPYFWIGVLPKEMMADPTATEAHAAVLRILPGPRFELNTTVKDNAHFIEVLDEAEFFSRTYFIFYISNPSE